MSAEIQSKTWTEIDALSNATIATTSATTKSGTSAVVATTTADTIAGHYRSWVERELEGMAPVPNMLCSVANLGENVGTGPRAMKEAAHVAYSFMQDLMLAVKKFTNPWIQLEMLAGYLRLAGLDALRVDNLTFAVRHQLEGEGRRQGEAAFVVELLSMIFAELGTGATVDSNQERTLVELGPLPAGQKQKHHRSRVALA
jgi:hypothetical protein